MIESRVASSHTTGCCRLGCPARLRDRPHAARAGCGPMLREPGLPVRRYTVRSRFARLVPFRMPTRVARTKVDRRPFEAPVSRSRSVRGLRRIRSPRGAASLRSIPASPCSPARESRRPPPVMRRRSSLVREGRSLPAVMCATRQARTRALPARARPCGRSPRLHVGGSEVDPGPQARGDLISIHAGSPIWPDPGLWAASTRRPSSPMRGWQAPARGTSTRPSAR